MARRAVSIAGLLPLILAVEPALSARAQAPDPRQASAVATKTTAAIRLDGRLDEEAWRQAPIIGAFAQREPQESGTPSEPTDVRVLYTDAALYFGVFCHDRSPRDIVSTQLARDADLSVDDSVTIVLDPFLDHRNGFFFQVNPAGARSDGQLSNNAERLTREWDGIWNAAARITGDGWVAEIEIPFKSLRFAPGQSTWGLNVERQIKRRQEIDRWTAARQNVWIGNLSHAGLLQGLVGIDQGVGLDVRPYASAGRDAGAGEAAAGGDVFKAITPSLSAAVTINTDFAETEADIRRINLTRFPLFFPEKRAFFLEGAGLFDIAGLGSSTDVRPFFSRRIGLIDDTTVPIRVGVKLTGRQAGYNIGVLDADAGTNLFAARVSRNVGRQSSVGGIVTHGNPSGTGANTLAGADARFATSTFRGDKNLAFEMFVLGTDDGASRTRAGAAGVRLDYPNDRWDVALNWKQIGADFRPALGFVARTGIRKTDVSAAFQPRPHRLGIRQAFFEINPVVVTDLANEVQSWSLFTAPLNILSESGEHVEWNYIPQFERLEAPFEIASGVVIPPGSYRFDRFRSEVNTAAKRPWVVDAAWWWGGFYGGRLRQLELGFTLKPNTHVAVSARAERNDIDLPQGRVEATLMTLRADYNFSPDVSWASLTQYDSESRVAGVQSRVRWILRPGTDLFLVLNRGWQRSLDDDRFEPLLDRGSVKLQYAFRF